MRRTLIALTLAAAAALAGPSDEAEMYLVGGAEPAAVIYEMGAPAREVTIFLEFRFGLYAISPEGRTEPATGGVGLEYRALGDDSYRPMEFQAEANPDWLADPAGEPGLWFTQGESLARVDRVIVFRFEREGRYEIRIRGLLDDSAHMRRIPTLAGVAEGEPVAEEDVEVIDDTDPEEALEVVEVVDEEPVVVERPIVVFESPPCPCPFCGASLYLSARIGHAGYWNCTGCSGAVHIHAGGRRRCSVLRGGRRSYYDLVHGRARGYVPPARRYGARSRRGFRKIRPPARAPEPVARVAPVVQPDPRVFGPSRTRPNPPAVAPRRTRAPTAETPRRRTPTVEAPRRRTAPRVTPRAQPRRTQPAVQPTRRRTTPRVTPPTQPRRTQPTVRPGRNRTTPRATPRAQPRRTTPAVRPTAPARRTPPAVRRRPTPTPPAARRAPAPKRTGRPAPRGNSGTAQLARTQRARLKAVGRALGQRFRKAHPLGKK